MRPISAGGRLILVTTPIGNLGDMTTRAAQALADADIVACEDTRRTGALLAHLGIRSPRKVVVNEHTEHETAAQLVDAMLGGKVVALTSDAGAPGISDPGERLVAACVDAGVEVTATPGPSAAIMGLTISGLPTGRWVFEGFLPRSGAVRTQRIAEVAAERRTIVLYESPHRLIRTLTDLASSCGGERRVVLARELTKLHEDVWRGTLTDAVAHTGERDPLGEYVVILDGATPPRAADDDDIAAALDTRLAAGVDRKTAIAEVAAELNVAKRRVYDLVLAAKKADTPRG